METINLTRTQILSGNYEYPSELVQLKPTNHFIERLEERGIGIDCIPTVVRVTKDNVHSAKSMDGKKLSSVVVRLKYTRSQWLFLCFNPYDGGLKTMWFRDINNVDEKRKNTKRNNSEAIPDS